MEFLIKRILSGLAVIFLISLFTFVVLMWIPGDPALLTLGTDATPEKLEMLRESMGLNIPWYHQYFNWLKNLLSSDWGKSYIFGEEVLNLILQRLPVTISLAVLGIVFALPLAVILGILSALYKDKWIDYISRSLIQLGDAIPQFWLALIFLVIFAGNLGLFPISGYVTMDKGIGKSFHSITLPSIVLAIGTIGPLIRIIRSSMLSALNQDYMLMTKVNGLTKWSTVFKYALRDAIIAPVTVLGMRFAGLLGGTVLIESIYALPGIGRLLLVSVEQRDLILLQGIVIFITGAVVSINIIMDVIYRLINPMIRFGGSNE